MKEITETVYVASDGRKFKSKTACEAHEAKISRKLHTYEVDLIFTAHYKTKIRAYSEIEACNHIEGRVFDTLILDSDIEVCDFEFNTKELED